MTTQNPNVGPTAPSSSNIPVIRDTNDLSAFVFINDFDSPDLSDLGNVVAGNFALNGINHYQHTVLVDDYINLAVPDFFEKYMGQARWQALPGLIISTYPCLNPSETTEICQSIWERFLRIVSNLRLEGERRSVTANVRNIQTAIEDELHTNLGRNSSAALVPICPRPALRAIPFHQKTPLQRTVSSHSAALISSIPDTSNINPPVWRNLFTGHPLRAIGSFFKKMSRVVKQRSLSAYNLKPSQNVQDLEQDFLDRESEQQTIPVVLEDHKNRTDSIKTENENLESQKSRINEVKGKLRKSLKHLSKQMQKIDAVFVALNNQAPVTSPLNQLLLTSQYKASNEEKFKMIHEGQIKLAADITKFEESVSINVPALGHVPSPTTIDNTPFDINTCELSELMDRMQRLHAILQKMNILSATASAQLESQFEFANRQIGANKREVKTVKRQTKAVSRSRSLNERIIPHRRLEIFWTHFGEKVESIRARKNKLGNDSGTSHSLHRALQLDIAQRFVELLQEVEQYECTSGIDGLVAILKNELGDLISYRSLKDAREQLKNANRLNSEKLEYLLEDLQQRTAHLPVPCPPTQRSGGINSAPSASSAPPSAPPAAPSAPASSPASSASAPPAPPAPASQPPSAYASPSSAPATPPPASAPQASTPNSAPPATPPGSKKNP